MRIQFGFVHTRFLVCTFFIVVVVLLLYSLIKTLLYGIHCVINKLIDSKKQTNKKHYSLVAHISSMFRTLGEDKELYYIACPNEVILCEQEKKTFFLTAQNSNFYDRHTQFHSSK